MYLFCEFGGVELLWSKLSGKSKLTRPARSPDIVSLALPDPRRQPVIAYSMNARRERVWDTTVPSFVLAPPELGWAIIG